MGRDLGLGKAAMILCEERLGDPLVAARAAQEDAARLGFDWPEISGALKKAREEIEEFVQAVEAGERGAIEHELGDILFSVVNLSRFVEASPSEVLASATRRFEVRFEGVQASVRDAGRAIEDCTLEELDVIWENVKRRDRGSGAEAMHPDAKAERVTERRLDGA